LKPRPARRTEWENSDRAPQSRANVLQLVQHNADDTPAALQLSPGQDWGLFLSVCGLRCEQENIIGHAS